MENIVQGQWFRGPSADLGEPINQSVRFTGDGRLVASTSATTGNFTLSFWWKRAIGVTNTHTFFMFTPNQAYQFTQGTEDKVASRVSSFDYLSDGKLRDHSAWYHLVFVNNSGTTTLYINGVQQSDTATTPSGSGDMTIGSNQASGQDDRLVGYLAEYNLLDGQTLTATDFGRYNDDGVWVPIALDFTAAQYGAKGFRLVFDSSADGGIGDDSAPTGTGHTAANDFTATGFETAAISSSNLDNDVDMNDTPTSNAVTFNPVDKSTNTVVDKALLSYSSSATWGKARSTQPYPSTGTWYYECDCAATPAWIGAVQGNKSLDNSSPATQSGYWLLISDNTRNFDGSYVNGGGGISNGDTLGVTYNADTDTMKWYKNNTLVLTATSVTPDTQSNLLFPLPIFYSADASTVNYGQFAFKYTPPDSAKACNEFLAETEPTIKNGKEHFEVITFTGNATQRNITGLEFQPDLVFAKNTATSGHWNWHDSVRGATKRLTSNSSAAETTYSDYLNAFNSDGFSVGTEGAINGNGNQIVAYCFKAGGTAVSNTDGTITSSVSANTDAGFSIVSYTGTGATGTLGHGLNATPEFVMQKNRDQTANWLVWHSALGLSHTTFPNWLYLSGVSGEQSSGSSVNHPFTQVPDDSLLYLNTATSELTNVNGDDHIAYCWHSVEGFSKFGQYAGHSNSHLDTNGSFVYCGFKPRWVMIKAITRSEPWMIFDSGLNAHNPSNIHLRANETSASTTYGEGIDIVSNGFKVRAGASIGEAANDFVYMAFAEHPFGGTNQPPATAR